MGLVRGIGVTVSNFTNTEQVDLLGNYTKRKKLEKLERRHEIFCIEQKKKNPIFKNFSLK